MLQLVSEHVFLLIRCDLRTNPSQEGENDEYMTKSKGKDPLEGLGGPMTRARVILLNS